MKNFLFAVVCLIVFAILLKTVYGGTIGVNTKYQCVVSGKVYSVTAVSNGGRVSIDATQLAYLFKAKYSYTNKGTIVLKTNKGSKSFKISTDIKNSKQYIYLIDFIKVYKLKLSRNKIYFPDIKTI